MINYHYKAIYRGIIIYFLLLLLITLIYSQTKDFGFINIDDDIYVYNNPYITKGFGTETVKWAFSSDRGGLWIPFTWLSFALDYKLHGLNPEWYHLENVILHALNVLLLFSLLSAATGKIYRSALVAVLFAVHPIHVESVAWITERKDVLSTFFFMISICSYFYYLKKPHIGRYLLIVITYIIGVMSKPMVLTLPALLILLDFWPLKRFEKTKFIKLLYEKIPLFVISIVTGIITLIIPYFRNTMESLQIIPLHYRIFNMLVSILIYIEKLFIPFNLSIYYHHEGKNINHISIYTAIIILTLLSYIVIKYIKKQPYLFIGWLWFILSVLPVTGIFQTGTQARADRFVYIPFIGLYLLIVWGTTELILKKRKKFSYPLMILSSIFIIFLTTLAHIQASTWKDGITVANHALKVTKPSSYIYDCLGNAYVKQKQYDEAEECFRNALNLDPDYEKSCSNLGNICVIKGKTGEAVSLLNRALSINPSSPETNYNMGVIKLWQNDLEGAEKYLRKAVSLREDYLDAELNLAVVLAVQKKYPEAEKFAGHVLKLNPKSSDANKNMGIICMQQNKFEDAEKYLLLALNYKPEDYEICKRLGILYESLGNMEKAGKYNSDAERLKMK